VAVLGIVALSSAAWADGPVSVPFRGELIDGQNAPISGVFPMEFRVYDSETGTAPVYTEPHFVAVVEGMYEIRMGVSQPLPPELLGRPVWVAVHLGSTGEISRVATVLAQVEGTPSREAIIGSLDITWADLAERAVQAEEALDADDCLRVGGKTLEELDRYEELLAQLVEVRQAVNEATRPSIGGRTTTLERIGGSGGLPYSRNCPPNHVVVGVRGGAGDLIDSIELICAPLE
jgi:hypothetical protein